MKRQLIILLFFALVLGFGMAQEPGVAGLDLFNRRVNPDSSITNQNAASLQQAWSFETESMVTSMPLSDGERVYVTDWGGWVYALAVDSGEKLWQTKAVEVNMEWPWYGLAGTGALDTENGVLVVASVEGEMVALSTEDGVVVWETSITDQPTGGNLSKLLHHDGVIYLGLQSVDEPLDAMREDFEPSFQGRMKAFDATTGELIWELPLVDAPHNGVAVWSSFALDPELGLLYFATGNNYTGEPTALSDSMIAVDAATGEIAWFYQVTQNDVWTPAVAIGPDYDFGAGPQLFEANIDGENRNLVGAGQKSGMFTVFDRETGEYVWSSFVGFPDVGGGIRGEAGIGDDRILVWSNNSYIDGKPPEDFPVTVKALDKATGRTLWFQDAAQPAAGWSGGFLANDVFFVGSLDGTLQAYDAEDGTVLWTGQAPEAVGSALLVTDDTLYVGYGVPEAFGGGPGGSGGVAAFRAGE